jgi:putative hemolysin
MLAILEPVKSAVRHGNAFFAVQHLKTIGFAPKIPIRIETEGFLIKTVENVTELERVLSLRYQVFYKEYRNALLPKGYDIDRYDLICDHLAIIDRKTDRIAGTYRLISSSFSDTFYSQEEFVMQSILDFPQTKLELGRACIHKDYRNGAVITALWKGLATYIRAVDAKILFGCSSVKSTDETTIAMVYKYMRDGNHLTSEFPLFPAHKYRMHGLMDTVAELDQPGSSYSVEAAKAEIPSLLESYLKAGAKLCGEPALDRDFRCADFLTVLRTEQLTRLFERRYRVR